MKDTLPIALAVSVALVLILMIKYLEPEQKAKQEALICGYPRTLAYVDNYEINNSYVIDLEHGGLYPLMICKAFRGEEECNTALGYNCED